MLSLRSHFVALFCCLIAIAAFLGAASDAHSATIYSPQASASKAVGPTGKPCKPLEFVDQNCWKEPAAKKQKASKKKTKKGSTAGGKKPAKSTTPASPTAPDAQSNEAVTGVVGSDLNWLKTNGLNSPICGKQSIQAKKVLKNNCERSGMASVPTPTGNLGLDVKVDASITKPGSWFAGTVQNTVSILWVLMANITAAMFAALEWSFSMNLLEGETLGKVGQQLKSIESAWTTPMVRLAMVFFAVWMVYYAAIRRQFRLVLSELGSSLGLSLIVLMIIANPIGTVGTVSKTVNDLALYSLNAIQSPTNFVAKSKQSNPNSYAEGLGGVFDSVVVRSWSLMQFGNVHWATSPKRLDPELKEVAVQLAADKSPSVKDAVADAKTNAALFLAFPPNTAERDGINDIDGKKTLLRVLCNNDDHNKCEGKYKSIADQRTAAGTDARIGQWFLVASGLLCVWIVLGMLAVGLLGASIASVFYLILVVVTAPAAWINVAGAKRKYQYYLGEFAGALVAKLLYAVALGIVILLFNVIVALNLTFLKQWILMIVAFIFLFKKRKELTALAPGLVRPGAMGRKTVNSIRKQRRRATREVTNRLREARDKRRDRLEQLGKEAAERSKKKRRERATEGPARPGAKPAVAHAVSENPEKAMVDTARRRAIGRGQQANADLGPLRTRLGRLSQQEHASEQKLQELKPGSREHKKEMRRQMSLKRRRERMDKAVNGARIDRERGHDVAGRPVDRAAETARAARIIDHQASLPATNRDYRQLSAMADLTPEAYDQLSGRERNQVRSAINQELRVRRSSTSIAAPGAGEFAANSTAPPPRRQPKSGSDLNRERVGGKRMRPTPRKRETQTAGR